MYSYLSQIETSFTVRFRRQLCNDLRYKLEQLLKMIVSSTTTHIIKKQRFVYTKMYRKITLNVFNNICYCIKITNLTGTNTNLTR